MRSNQPPAVRKQSVPNLCILRATQEAPLNPISGRRNSLTDDIPCHIFRSCTTDFLKTFLN